MEWIDKVKNREFPDVDIEKFRKAVSNIWKNSRKPRKEKIPTLNEARLKPIKL